MPAVHKTPAAQATTTLFIVVQAGDRNFALPADAVTEVIRMVALTELPGSPDWFAGVLNLRGVVIAVVDLPVRLGFGGHDYGLATPIVVVHHGDLRFAVIVDAVVGLTEGRLTDSEAIGSPAIGGVAAMDGALVPVIDLPCLGGELEGALPRR